MEAYKNFQIAAYVYAYYLAHADDAKIQQDIDFYKAYIPLKKVYIENHRGKVDITPERLREVKAIFEANGIETSGGITSTQYVNGIRKPSFYDTFCYTDPAHRKEYRRIVSELAGVFDEIILDDFFFTACRCEMCIEAKGKRSWMDYRLKLMEDFSHEIVDLARSINPKMNFIIKYPNWYESFQETGYNPGKQKDIFDMVYTGTETRDPKYSPQHLQRYESYSLVRLLENTAPGRNGGGWIDLGGSSDNLNVYLEQADLTLFAKAPELMLFNFSSMVGSNALPALGNELKMVDHIVGKLGNPIGVSAWEPYDGDGEDQAYNYLGMCGAAIEPHPEMQTDAPVVLFTESTAHAPDAMEKLEAYVRKGGNAVVTTGFFKKMYDKGIKDLTSVRLTGRHVLGSEYMISHANYMAGHFATSTEPVLFEILNYKTNATNSDISLIAGENNFPIMTEDNYGKGRFFILNLPENFADLYKLPLEVIRGINKHLSMGQRVYLGCRPKFNLFAYDNNVYGVQSYRPMGDKVQVIVRGECKGIRLLGWPREITECLTQPKPACMGDATTVIDEPTEYAFELPVWPGRYTFFEIID
ncbi:MAG: hypothetical protein E7428_07465 [Ruminococcaceae bacterium]|nr:hypothetical protein [Oscillospiraceae bacterium]